MPKKDLEKLNLTGALSHDDINLYTTSHYYHGTRIARAFRARQKARLEGIGESLDAQSPTLLNNLVGEGA